MQNNISIIASVIRQFLKWESVRKKIFSAVKKPNAEKLEQLKKLLNNQNKPESCIFIGILHIAINIISLRHSAAFRSVPMTHRQYCRSVRALRQYSSAAELSCCQTILLQKCPYTVNYRLLQHIPCWVASSLGRWNLNRCYAQDT